MENRKQDREKRAAREDISLMLFCMFPLFGLDVGPEGNKTQRHSCCRVSGDVCPALLFCGAELPGAQEPALLPCLEPVKQTLIRSNSSQVTNGLTAFGSDKPLGALNPADLHTLTQDSSAAFAGTFH